jgi:hypothetical protein
MRKSWILVCFVNFFIASLMGLLLRWMYVAPTAGVNFQFLMHGHSHVAMLGWVYLMLYCFIFYFFIPKESQQKPVYNRLFWITEIAVVGMMIDFPAQGYAFASILFSTMHIFCSYYFCFLVAKNAKPTTHPEKKMLQTALFFMVFSTLGVWSLGPAVGMMGKASAFYQIAIQFFLHFQFNGWFLFAVLALFLKQLNGTIDKKQFLVFYRLFISSTFLTLALPVSWSIDNSIFYWINALGVLLQLGALVVFIPLLRSSLPLFFNKLNTITKNVYRFALFSLVLKVIIQLVVLLPELEQVSHEIRNFVIGYIHLAMLGIITAFLFGFALQNNFLNSKNRTIKWGITFFFFGYATTEILLFMQGIYFFLEKGQLPNYYQNLFITSIALPTGLLLVLISLFFKTKFQHKHIQNISF